MSTPIAGAPASADAKTKVFVSYSRKDLAFVDRLAAGLEAHAIAPKIDRTEIYSFEDWWTRIQALIAEADTIVFVLSPDALASDICRKEVDYALSLRKRFAPIVCRPVAAEMDRIPPALAQLNFIFFDQPDGFDPAMATLVEALSTDIGWVRKHTAFGLDARAWAEAGKPKGLLLRSPRLDEAESWIAARPSSAPAATEETQAFLLASRQSATARRNILTGSLAAGLVVAVGLAGLAFWQRSQAVEQRQIADAQTKVAVEQRQIADAQTKVAVTQEGIARAATTRAEVELAAETAARKEATAQKDRATKLLNAATDTAQSLVDDLAIKFRQTKGIPLAVTQGILARAKGLLDQLESFHEDSPAMQLNRIVTDSELGLTLAQQNSPDGVTDIRAAYDLVVKLEHDAPNLDGVDYAHGRAAEVLGQIEERSDPAKAYAHYQEAAAAYSRCAGSPTGLSCLEHEIYVGGHVGNLFQNAQQYANALLVDRQALDMALAYQKRAPPGPDVDLMLGQRYNHIGDSEYGLAHDEAARQAFAAAIAYFEPWQSRPNPSSTLTSELAGADNGMSLVIEGDALRTRDRSKLQMALDFAIKDVTLLDGLATADPANLFYWSNLARAADHVASLEQAVGNRSASGEYMRKRDAAITRAKGGT